MNCPNCKTEMVTQYTDIDNPKPLYYVCLQCAWAVSLDGKCVLGVASDGGRDWPRTSDGHIIRRRHAIVVPYNPVPERR
jgi:hypothetical protein